MTSPTTDTDLRDQIERYRDWLSESLASTDAYLRDHPDSSERVHGQADATFSALEMLNAAVPQKNPLAASEPTQH